MVDRPEIELLRRYLSGNVSEQEKARVEEWYEKHDRRTGFGDTMPVADEIREAIYDRIAGRLNIHTPVVPFYRTTAFRIAAAVILVFISGLAYYMSISTHHDEPAVASVAPKVNDVAPPATNKAVLTLASGKKIFVESASTGELAKEGMVRLTKQADGQIAYTGKASDAIQYNKLSVPRASKPINLRLADGTMVWLNVASSITYPTAFVGHERKVSIDGEAYFEVTKNHEMPFVVQHEKSDLQVRVLGTHFNVNTYPDEASMNVTLLEGSVAVTKNDNHILLTPGEQAQVTANAIKRGSNVDLEEVMAWKNGTFYFDGTDIAGIMRQVEKWYGVDVTYQDKIKYSFVANISRDVNASQLLHILELTNLVHFKIEGNKITVMK